MNEQKVLLLSSTPYDFKDEQTGRQVTGLTLWVLPLSSSDKYTNGIKPVKYSLNKQEFEALFNSIELPSYATMQFEFDFSRSRVTPTYFSDFEVLEVGALSE